MSHLGIDEGDAIVLTTTQLPKGTFARFKPLDEEFYKVENPRAVYAICE